MADPLDTIARICSEQPHDALTQIADALGYTEQREQERAQREQTLAGLVKRLAWRLHPEDNLRVTATDYLKEQGFFNPLRAAGVPPTGAGLPENTHNSVNPAVGVLVDAPDFDTPENWKKRALKAEAALRAALAPAPAGVRVLDEAQLVWQFAITGEGWCECSESNARAYLKHGAPFKVRVLREVEIPADGVALPDGGQQ